MNTSRHSSFERDPDDFPDRQLRASHGRPQEVEGEPSAPGPSARDLLCPLRRAIDLHLRGDFEGAERRLRAVLDLDPHQPQAHHHLAVVLHSRGRTVEAIRHLAHALVLDPHLVGAEERLAAYRAEQLMSRDARPSLPSGGDDHSTHDAA